MTAELPKKVTRHFYFYGSGGEGFVVRSVEQRRKVLLGQLLMENNLITQEQLSIALAKQKHTDDLLGVVLVQLGFIRDEELLLPFVAQQHGVDYIRLKHINIEPEIFSKIPAKFALRYKVIPVELHDSVLTVAMGKPYDVLLRDEIRMLTDCEVNPVLASSDDIVFAIHKHYGIGIEIIEEIMNHTELKEKQESSILRLNAESEATINDFLNQILLKAYRDRASDIHIEPFESRMSIRLRIDGVMQEMNVPQNITHFREAISSRIKIMSQLDIAEKRRPQDGRFRIHIEDMDLDFRVSFVPTPHGESIVLRMLNSTRLYTFDELNLGADEKELLVDLIHRPHGIIFMTGPTGSGKTTTLYSCLAQINNADKKIITLEDPVEYQIPSITQIQVNPAIKLTFASGLRSVLRHDPDVILVGEVRDVETAEIAVQVALTGHLIFSTLHTNDAASGVTRLLNMGIEPYLITSTVQCFVAQRLVRVVCPGCRVKKPLSQKMIEKFEPHHKGELFVAVGKGCEECNFTGYKGRAGIFEFLVLKDEIGELILERASASELKKKAVSLGMKTLRQSGWEKVKMGITTPEEIIRVTQERAGRK